MASAKLDSAILDFVLRFILCHPCFLGEGKEGEREGGRADFFEIIRSLAGISKRSCTVV
jgi:hypothetical protein